jgi:hypothetical protein
VLAVLAVMVLAGCSAPRPAPPPPARPAPNPFQAQVRAASYAVTLAGGAGRASPGAPAAATVAISPPGDRVCWAIPRLRAAPGPLHAYIRRGRVRDAGPVVIPLGGAFRATGCVTGTAPALLARIEADPGGYYLAIHGARYPGGAVRGQLQGTRHPAGAS